MPLNKHITINFSELEYPGDAVKLFSYLRLNRFNKWASRPKKGAGKAFKPTGAYVFENAKLAECFNKLMPELEQNIHVHWLLHIPPDRQFEFQYKLFEWLDGLTDKLNEKNAIKIQDITHLKGMRSYVLKGTANRRLADHFGAEKHFAPQGLVEGLRSGVTRNLGPSARKSLDKVLNIRRSAA